MIPIRWTTIAATIGVSIAIAGCSTTPEPLQGEYSQAFFPKEATEDSVGSRVRWGGSIVQTNPQSERTCVEVLAYPLDDNFYPETSDDERGRFLACQRQFMDPEVFEKDRKVTVVGTLESFEKRDLGEFEYNYPLVSADSIYLWPEEDEYYDGYGYRYHTYPYRSYHYPYGHGLHYGGFHHGGFHYGGLHHY